MGKTEKEDRDRGSIIEKTEKDDQSLSIQIKKINH